MVGWMAYAEDWCFRGLMEEGLFVVEGGLDVPKGSGTDQAAHLYQYLSHTFPPCTIFHSP